MQIGDLVKLKDLIGNPKLGAGIGMITELRSSGLVRVMWNIALHRYIHIDLLEKVNEDR